MGGVIGGCTHGIGSDITGKGLHQAKIMCFSSPRVLISTGVDLLSCLVVV